MFFPILCTALLIHLFPSISQQRMARILFLFEKHGIRTIVLGSFGTGVFKNDVRTVAGLWRELLVGDKAPFRTSFDRVQFAIIGHETYTTFLDVFHGAA